MTSYRLDDLGCIPEIQVLVYVGTSLRLIKSIFRYLPNDYQGFVPGKYRPSSCAYFKTTRHSFMVGAKDRKETIRTYTADTEVLKV
jgi:hypothetical protein